MSWVDFSQKILEQRYRAGGGEGVEGGAGKGFGADL